MLNDRLDGGNVPLWMLRVYYEFHYLPSLKSVTAREEAKAQEDEDKMCGVCLQKGMKAKRKDMCAKGLHRVHLQCKSNPDACKKCSTALQRAASPTEQTAKET